MLTTTQPIHRNPKHIASMTWAQKAHLNITAINAMSWGEILLSRYDHFINNHMVTHATTNLSASELEDYYGNRVRSRMREMFNLIAFDSSAKDKRK